jgi:hypothetical protein
VSSILVLGDSLTYHGPSTPVPPTDPRLYPNVCAARLAPGCTVDLLARPGWTARDAWWGLTKDPMSWGVYLPRATGLVIGVGGMDHLPAAAPTWLRESVPYIRHGRVRRATRTALLTWSPHIIRWTGGRMRQLPQAVTDRYLTRIVEAVRHLRPDLPTVLLGPSPYDARTYPADRHHESARAAARRWAAVHGVEYVDPEDLVGPSLRAGRGNPDGMHWSWEAHEAVGSALADALNRAGWSGSVPSRGVG